MYNFENEIERNEMYVWMFFTAPRSHNYTLEFIDQNLTLA